MIGKPSGFSRPARLVAAGFFAGALLASELYLRAAAPILSWVNDRTDTNRWFVEVSGLAASVLKELQRAHWTAAQWEQLLTVHAEQGDLISDIGMPAMTGSYGIENNGVRFVPAFPIEPGLRYRASFYPDKLSGNGGQGRFVTALFHLPAPAALASTIVKQIYPSADLLPENLLKFYVHFSAPMARGHIYDHIHLRDSAGKDIELPFLEIDEELWDPSMTRLTLFIDPGRIKRGVTPLEEVGPALQQSQRYTLLIASEWKDAMGARLQKTFEKRFRVGPPDRDPIEPAQWKIQPPKAITREPLIILFPKSLDHALAQRVIRVMDAANRAVVGRIDMVDEERRWRFVPADAWASGRYSVSVEKTLEDLAGNNIGKAFEVDLFESVQRRFTNAAVKLPFEVR